MTELNAPELRAPEPANAVILPPKPASVKIVSQTTYGGDPPPPYLEDVRSCGFPPQADRPSPPRSISCRRPLLVETPPYLQDVVTPPRTFRTLVGVGSPHRWTPTRFTGEARFVSSVYHCRPIRERVVLTRALKQLFVGTGVYWGGCRDLATLCIFLVQTGTNRPCEIIQKLVRKVISGPWLDAVA